MTLKQYSISSCVMLFIMQFNKIFFTLFGLYLFLSYGFSRENLQDLDWEGKDAIKRLFFFLLWLNN